ncbi:hypothetical protein [Roseivirga pacifica]|uniref:hypothetical protein n=1 Tax=Roseivirga pacifica TaxID=1267423 RepID=UPI00227ADE83|nr:hypothetical protein [Roseivirga pacifica]
MSKASTLARVRNGEFLPVHNQYFLQSYEACLQTTEVLEAELDKIWPSSNFRDKTNSSTDEQKESVEKVIEESKETKKTTSEE